MSTFSNNRIFDGFNKNTGQSTEVMAVRVFSSQKELLNNCYTGNTSVLIRLLLKHYFEGKLPEVAKEFLQLTR
jgi:hypothetical protein